MFKLNYPDINRTNRKSPQRNIFITSKCNASKLFYPSIHPSIDPSNVHVPETTTIFFSDQNVESENVESSVAADKREIEARTFLYRGEDLVGARGVYA